jgi:tetratricopeptide (TPR) repeat protein
MRQKLFHGAHPAVAESQFCLAEVLGNANDYPASIVLHEQALATRLTLLGDAHPDVAESLNGLGFVLREAGRAEEAQEMGVRALSIALRALGAEHRTTAYYQRTWSNQV